MAKRRKRRTKSIPMKIGNDPTLWRFASLQDALEANTDLIARLIRVGEEQSQTVSPGSVAAEIVPTAESA